MPAAWLLDWWTLWCDEPWGDDRADLRAWAHVLMGLGAKNLELTWPYSTEWTIADIQAEIDRLEMELGDDGDRRENQHSN